MIKANKSDAGFEEMFFLVDTYAKLKNPHLFFDLSSQDRVELAVEREYIRMLIEEKIQVGEL